ncbi:hypothetical protein FD754_013721 [Muntiacus muntjak]|uniref:Uncharacterized protein n=1 Tax=Muntiacus muntjak TaxID=9888 RepID=A0A5N3VIB1_MUNMU|nr:hypothetical protein FD754_013721 [Muntiacus muntjak]
MQKSCEEKGGKPQNTLKAEEDSPWDEGASQEAEGNLRGGLTLPGHDTPVGHLDHEEIRGAGELERRREERRKVRNKSVMMD